MYKPSLYANYMGEKWLPVVLHSSTFLSDMLQMVKKKRTPFLKEHKVHHSCPTRSGMWARADAQKLRVLCPLQDRGQTSPTSQRSSGTRWHLALRREKHSGLRSAKLLC